MCRYMFMLKKTTTTKTQWMYMFCRRCRSILYVACRSQGGVGGKTFIPTFVWPALSHFVCPALNMEGAWWGKDVFQCSMFFLLMEQEVVTSLKCVWCEMSKCGRGKHLKMVDGPSAACGNWISNPSSPKEKKSGPRPWRCIFHVVCDLMFFSFVRCACFMFEFSFRLASDVARLRWGIRVRYNFMFGGFCLLCCFSFCFWTFGKL